MKAKIYYERFILKHIFYGICSLVCLELRELLLHVFLDSLHEVLGVQIHAFLDVLQAVDAAGQILGHLATVHAVNASGFQGSAESNK